MEGLGYRHSDLSVGKCNTLHKYVSVVITFGIVAINQIWLVILLGISILTQDRIEKVLPFLLRNSIRESAGISSSSRCSRENTTCTVSEPVEVVPRLLQ